MNDPVVWDHGSRVLDILFVGFILGIEGNIIISNNKYVLTYDKKMCVVVHVVKNIKQKTSGHEQQKLYIQNYEQTNMNNFL